MYNIHIDLLELDVCPYMDNMRLSGILMLYVAINAKYVDIMIIRVMNTF